MRMLLSAVNGTEFKDVLLKIQTCKQGNMFHWTQEFTQSNAENLLQRP
jgi:hypothetical protein